QIQGLVLWPEGNRVATLSDDGEQLDFWDLEHKTRIDSVSLRSGLSSAVDLPGTHGGDSSAPEPASADRSDSGQTANATSTSGPTTQRSGNNTAQPGGRRSPFWSSQRLALAGHSVATVLPDGHGFRLIDALSGATIRTVLRPNLDVLRLI